MSAFIETWLPSISVTGVVIVVSFLYRDFFLKWLYPRIEHHFNQRIEKFKSELRISEQEIQNRLVAHQKQIETLYGSTLALSSARQSAIDKRRLDAIERVWNSAMSLSKASASMKILESLNFDEVLKTPPSELTGISHLFEALDKTFGSSVCLEKGDQLSLLSEERPFVSTTLWANYSAFHALVIHGILVVSLLGKNMFDPKFFKFHAIREVIKAVLPHRAAGIDAYGVTYCYMCAPELLEALLRTVQQDLDGKQQDAADIARANRIMEAAIKAGAIAEELRTEASKAAFAQL